MFFKTLLLFLSAPASTKDKFARRAETSARLSVFEPIPQLDRSRETAGWQVRRSGTIVVVFSPDNRPGTCPVYIG